MGCTMHVQRILHTKHSTLSVGLPVNFVIMALNVLWTKIDVVFAMCVLDWWSYVHIVCFFVQISEWQCEYVYEEL